MNPNSEPQSANPLDQVEIGPSSLSTDTTKRRPNYILRWFFRLSFLSMIIFAGLAAFAWYAYQRAQVVPDYYQELLKQPIEQLAAAGNEFEIEVLELQNSAIETGEWQAKFSQDQINGWLVSDLPKKFPNSIPSSVTQPRVSLDDDELKFIFRFESQRFSGIVEASGDAYCTENLNEIAIRLNHIKSGLISLPIRPWTEKISKVMEKNDFPFRWTESDGDMIALITLPHRLSDQKDQKRIIESIEILDGQLQLHGITLAPEDLESYRDRNAKRIAEPSPVRDR